MDVVLTAKRRETDAGLADLFERQREVRERKAVLRAVTDWVILIAPPDDDQVSRTDRLGDHFELVGGNVDEFLDAFGRKGLDLPPYFLEVLHVTVDERLIVVVVFDGVADETVYARRVVAGLGAEVVIGIFGNTDFPWIEHHEAGPITDVAVNVILERASDLRSPGGAGVVTIGTADGRVEVFADILDPLGTSSCSGASVT